ncbi:MAG: oxygenase MpaB family protein, partial [Chloroflexia bacterium]
LPTDRSPVAHEDRAASDPSADAPVTRKINRELVVMLGWAPAMLMQFTHPLVAAAIADHSVAISDPRQRTRRLQQTVCSMLAFTFGTPDEAAGAARNVVGIHDRVHGKLRVSVGPYAAGTDYSAHDPELLTWVHVTLMDVLPRTYELFVGPLSDEEKAQYYTEAARMEVYLQAPPDSFPRSAEDVHEHIETMRKRGALVVGSDAREAAKHVLAPIPSCAGQLLTLPARFVTIGLTPPPFRRAYGLRWTVWHERTFRFVAGLSRRIVPRLPSVVRHWPSARRTTVSTATTACTRAGSGPDLT